MCRATSDRPAKGAGSASSQRQSLLSFNIFTVAKGNPAAVTFMTCYIVRGRTRCATRSHSGDWNRR